MAVWAHRSQIGYWVEFVFTVREGERLEMVKHHGYDCVVCKFNFQSRYGTSGMNFIHVQSRVIAT